MPGYLSAGQPLRLKQGHPLARGLVACFAPTKTGSVVDLTGRRGSAAADAVQFGPYGVCSRGWVITQPQFADLQFTSGPWTVASLVKREGTWFSGEYPQFFGAQAYVSEGNNQGWGLAISGGGSPGVWRFASLRNTTTSGGFGNIETANNTGIGDHLVVGTSDGVNLRTLYVDGISQVTGSGFANPIATATSLTNSASSNIKVLNYYSMAWNRALTAAEVNYLWLSGTDLIRARRNRVGWTAALATQNPGTARISQLGALTVEQGVPAGRISQIGALSVEQGVPAGRVSQVGALIIEQLASVRVSQVGGLAVVQGQPAARVSQAGVLTAWVGTPQARVSQVGVLAVYKFGETPVVSARAERSYPRGVVRGVSRGVA